MASKKQNWAILGIVGIVGLLVYEYFNSGGTSNAATPDTSQVNTGAILNYNAIITTGFFTQVSDALSQIATVLQGEGINVTNSQSNNSILEAVEGFLSLSGQNFGITLQVQVNNSGYAQATDLQSVIDNAVYQATGALPTSSSIAFASNQSTATVQGAAQSNPATGGLTGFFAQFGAGAATGILLALAGIVGLVILDKEAKLP